ncbi:hypothetical protein B14911_13452 [Bacillus sp. NRRL B-14911]|nr:hypothetical protein B14911_13452 [Bacillus sp. NRRL B-14911]
MYITPRGQITLVGYEFQSEMVSGSKSFILGRSLLLEGRTRELFPLALRYVFKHISPYSGDNNPYGLK